MRREGQQSAALAYSIERKKHNLSRVINNQKLPKQQLIYNL